MTQSFHACWIIKAGAGGSEGMGTQNLTHSFSFSSHFIMYYGGRVISLRPGTKSLASHLKGISCKK